MAEILPIFGKYAPETLQEEIGRKRKESLSLLGIYARLAYGTYLTKTYGKNSPEAKEYDFFTGENGPYRAWISHEWIDIYYRYHPMHSESHRQSAEAYRNDIQERYEKMLEDITGKMSAPEYPRFGGALNPEP